MVGFYSKVEIFGGVQNKDGGRAPEDLSTYRHGQYKGCSVGGTFGYANSVGSMLDDHHKPLNPDSYIHLRVEPNIRFYQRRLPKYHRVCTITELLLILGALSGMLLVFLDADQWVAIVTAISVSLTALINFNNSELSSVYVILLHPTCG